MPGEGGRGWHSRVSHLPSGVCTSLQSNEENGEVEAVLPTLLALITENVSRIKGEKILKRASWCREKSYTGS